MPLKEIQSKTFIVLMPPTEDGGRPIEIARIFASETIKELCLTFNRQLFDNKKWLEGIPLAPIFARYIGQALVEAADISDKAWPTLPPTDVPSEKV